MRLRNVPMPELDDPMADAAEILRATIEDDGIPPMLYPYETMPIRLERAIAFATVAGRRQPDEQPAVVQAIRAAVDALSQMLRCTTAARAADQKRARQYLALMFEPPEHSPYDDRGNDPGSGDRLQPRPRTQPPAPAYAVPMPQPRPPADRPAQATPRPRAVVLDDVL